MVIASYISGRRRRDRLIEVRHQIETEIQLTQSQLGNKNLNNVEILALVIGFLAIYFYFPLSEHIFSFIVGVFVISILFYTWSSRQMSFLFLLFEKSFGINQYLNWKDEELEGGSTKDFPPKTRILMIISNFLIFDQNLMIMRFHKNRDKIKHDPIFRTNVYLKTDCFAKNKFHSDISHVFITAFAIFLSSFFIGDIFKIDLTFFVLSIIILFLIVFVWIFNNTIRFFILNDINSFYYIPYIAWILATIIITRYTYSKYGIYDDPIFWFVVTLFTITFILIFRDLVSSFILNGKMEDKILDLLEMKNQIDQYLLGHEGKKINPEDIYLKYLIEKSHATRRLRFFFFNFDVLVPNIDKIEIKTILASEPHAKELKSKLHMREIF
ncbi:MAG: hypothetical protein KAV25_00315 [Methanophagales archaeon]|nr:hypothetical protein [Methanophagales archaeon]